MYVRFFVPSLAQRANPTLERQSSTNSRNSASMSTSANIISYTHGLAGVNLDTDRLVIRGLWISIASVVCMVLLARLSQLCDARLRHMLCTSSSQKQQTIWSVDRHPILPWLKKHIVYAPLGRKRHNREIQISKATNYGTIPGRLHVVLLSLYLVSNLVYCALLEYGNQPRPALIAEVRGRAGILAVANLIPLVIFAGRNNPLIPLMKVSFDTFNLFHRWIGRIVILESAIHILAWYVNYRDARGQLSMSGPFNGNVFLQSGLIAMIVSAIISIQSVSVIRHAFYEIFLAVHQLLAVASISCIYLHIAPDSLPALPYLRIAIVIWALERFLRLTRLAYLNVSRCTMTTLTLEALPGEACRITFYLARPVTIRPGSHVFAYIPQISLWMSHPFSVAWTRTTSEPPIRPSSATIDDNESPKSPSSLEKQTSDTGLTGLKNLTIVSMVVAARTGMTRALYDRALAASGHKVDMTGWLEGPYAGHESLESYGTVFMFAGGVGITHHLVQIRHLLASVELGTIATKKIVLVWSIRNLTALKWVADWMEEIMAMPVRREILKIRIHITSSEIQYCSSWSSSVAVIYGRVRPGTVLDEELPSRVGATMISVCGPGAFADEVRAAVRSRMHVGAIDLNEESFTW